MPQAEPETSTVLRFPTRRKARYYNPNWKTADLPDSVAKIWEVRLAREGPRPAPKFPTATLLVAVLSSLDPTQRWKLCRHLQESYLTAVDPDRIEAALWWMSHTPSFREPRRDR